MFVSSYSNYITTNTSEKTTKVKPASEEVKKEPFTLETQSSLSAIAFDAKTSLPINYVSSNKTFSNKRELDNQVENLNDRETQETNKDLEKFSKEKTFQSATTSYTENLKSYSMFRSPKPSLTQTPKLDMRDDKLKDLQTKALAGKMVNTYQANDRYFKITA